MILAFAALAGCEGAAMAPQQSLLEECNPPTPSNVDWCRSLIFRGGGWQSRSASADLRPPPGFCNFFLAVA